MKEQFIVRWMDSGEDPHCAPNPAYPNGIDLDCSCGVSPACIVSLPYPAKRIGAYTIECRKCGLFAGCTTAGRVDDPRSIKLPCKVDYEAN